MTRASGFLVNALITHGSLRLLLGVVRLASGMVVP